VISLIPHQSFFHANATADIHAISHHIGHVKTQIAVDILGKANASQETTAINHDIAVIVNIIFAVNFGFSLIQSATF
jgi:tRNA A37 threonylcarbamoyladenosine dehydratase